MVFFLILGRKLALLEFRLLIYTHSMAQRRKIHSFLPYFYCSDFEFHFLAYGPPVERKDLRWAVTQLLTRPKFDKGSPVIPTLLLSCPFPFSAPST
jgi:hypothetical protein